MGLDGRGKKSSRGRNVVASDCGCRHRGLCVTSTIDCNVLAMLRTFIVFFIGGLLMTAAVVSLFLIGSIVWTDCVHDNPNHTCGDALLFAAVAPVYGVMIGMAVYFLPLIVGAALAVFGRAVFRRLPLWYLMAILPACFLAYSTQPSSWFTHDPHTLSERLLMFSAFQVPALLICWWWDQRKTWT